MLLNEEILELPANYTDYKSEMVLNNADGLKNATERNLEKQRWILELPQEMPRLFSEMPVGEKPASGGVQVCLKTLKSLLNLHRGELREWHGSGRWERQVGGVPNTPGMWHPQFFPPHVEDPTATSTVLSKLPAAVIQPGGHFVRVAIVIGLGDLFYDYGQSQSCRSLYHVWTHLRVFAHRRDTTIASSRQRNARHWRYHRHWRW